MQLRIGTADGLLEPPDGITIDGPVRIFGDAALGADGRIWWRRDAGWSVLASAAGLLCAADAPGGLLFGTEGAHLRRVGPHGLEPLPGFDATPGRDGWHTPWGGPPDVRSLAVTEHNVLLANVHVGGIARSVDAGRTWMPTIDVNANVHQVRAVEGRAELVLAAAAVGLCRSDDAGATWHMIDDGLHATYCRAIAATPEMVLMSASEGPRGRRSAIYRRPLAGDAAFERVTEWLDGNVDTHTLDARGDDAAFGTREGIVWHSHDAGATWAVAHEGLAPITSISIVA